MKKHFLTMGVLAAALMAGTNVFAYDFEANGVYYNILSESDKTVEVTNSGTSPYYDGIVNAEIPEKVANGDKTYTVTAIGNYAFQNCRDLVTVDIPATVTLIGNYAFDGCYNLERVSNGDDITSIGEYAFDGCTSLVGLNWGHSLTEIKDFAFTSCSSLASVDFPNTLKYIGRQTFGYCHSLKSVDIPASVEAIEGITFSGCKGLTEINVDEGNANYASVDGSLYSKDLTLLITVPAGKESYDFIDETTTIDERAFMYCPMTSIEIPANILNVGENPFQYCENMQTIEVDENNPNYTSADGILYSKDMTLLHSVPQMKSSVDIPNTVTTIGEFAFFECENITSIEIPNSVVTLLAGAFQSCNGLTSIEIPNSVETIDQVVFAYMDNLETVTIGSSVKTIGSNAFGGSMAITKVYCMPQTPPVLSWGTPMATFNGLVYQNATLYVPQGSKSDYQAVEPWSYFENIEEIVGTGIDGVAASDDEVSISVADGSIVVSGASGVDVYSLDGTQVYGGTAGTVNGLPSGVYVVKADGKTAKVAL